MAVFHPSRPLLFPADGINKTLLANARIGIDEESAARLSEAHQRAPQRVADALVVIVRLAALELRIALGTLPVPPLQDGESEFDAQIIAKERQTKLAEASALLKAVAASEAAGSGGAEQEEVFADVVSFAFDPTTAFLLDHDDADKPKECSKCASRDWVDP